MPRTPKIIRDNNYTEIQVSENLVLYFSYRECIAFKVSDILVISENVWSTTTGFHLNTISPDHKIRINNDEFTKQLDNLLHRLYLFISSEFIK